MSNRKDIRSLISPEMSYLRSLSESFKADDAWKTLIFRGVVTYVDRIGSDVHPRFSVQAKILGIDSFNTVETVTDNFYPPLFPIQQISIPEVGEEILIICEELGNLATGFWISRPSNINKLSKEEIGENIDVGSDKRTESKYGTPELPTETQDVNPETKEIPIPRVKPGDVVEQGRSNTFVRHTFDQNSKRGIIEGITEEQPINDADFFKKNFRESEGSRIVLSTQSNLDKEIIEETNNLEFHQNFGVKNLESAYLLLEALELRLVSREGGKVQHAVLGEDQEVWIKQLITVLKAMIDDVSQLISAFESHFHFVSEVKAGTDSAKTGGIDPASAAPKDRAQTGLNSRKVQLDSSANTIKDHHSKKVALN